jgi:hypothetical protein
MTSGSLAYLMGCGLKQPVTASILGVVIQNRLIFTKTKIM